MSGGDDVSRWESALAGLDTFPRQRVSVYGSWLWWRLGRVGHRGLSRRELVGLLRTGMCAQSVLSLLHCRGVSPVGATARATVAALVPSRNSTLFGHLLTASGTPPRRVPFAVRALVRLTAWLPIAPVDRGLRSLIEELAAQHPAAAPRPAMRLLTLARHLRAAHADLIIAVESRQPLAEPMRRWSLAAATTAAYAVVSHPQIYRAAGILAPPGMPDDVAHCHHAEPVPALRSAAPPGPAARSAVRPLFTHCPALGPGVPLCPGCVPQSA
ncbi:hypothetical protein [Nocardia terpenica]|uniref:Uncharacterized protein n=1 Tax=Nocardia terpenica TaxID=455432 RepID=A0A6G9Z3I7_9NOCA|nr:hypothetical protein [Nocardia terpenica]QIS20010.1 hypothetical protein F6W96_18615 [Nocardia terpenica]